MGGEVLAVLAEVEQGVAELAVQRELVPAEEIQTGDVERVGWLGGVGRCVRIFGEIARKGFAREGLPGEDEVEAGVIFLKGVILFHVVLLQGDLEGEVGGFDGDKTGLTPADGGDLVDEFAFGVGGGKVAFVLAGEMGFPFVGVFRVDDDVVFGGEAVLEGIEG